DFVFRQRNDRICSDAFDVRTRDEIVLDQVASSDGGPLRASAQIDAAAQQLRFRAFRSIQIVETVAQDLGAETYLENPAVLRAFDDAIGDCDRFPLHIGIGVVHYNPEILLIDAQVARDLSIVKSVQIDALSIDLAEPVERINTPVDIA